MNRGAKWFLDHNEGVLFTHCGDVKPNSPSGPSPLCELPSTSSTWIWSICGKHTNMPVSAHWNESVMFIFFLQPSPPTGANITTPSEQYRCLVLPVFHHHCTLGYFGHRSYKVWLMSDWLGPSMVDTWNAKSIYGSCDHDNGLEQVATSFWW